MIRYLFILLAAADALADTTADSLALENALERLEPAARVEMLLDRAKAIRRNDPRAAIVLAERARAEAEPLGDAASLGRADITAGVGHLFLGEYREAMESFRSSLGFAEAADDTVAMANALNNIGVIHFYWGEHDLAADYYLRAIRFRELLKDFGGLAPAYNNVAAVLQTAGEYDRALEYFQRSLAIYAEDGDVSMQASTLNNIGLVYYDLEQYDDAMAAYDRALELGRSVGDKPDAALTLNNMGMVWEKRGELETALARYRESLAIREEIGDRQGTMVCRHNIGVIQSEQGDHERALANLEASLAEARELEVLEFERDNLESLALVLEREGDSEQALAIFKQYKDADDALRDQERTRQMIAAQTRFDVDLKDREIVVLRKDKEIEQSRRNALLVGAALFLLIIALLFQRYRFQKRAANEIRRTNEALRQAHAELARAARDELAHVARVATMGELAAAFAHELNQPLAAIQANARAGCNYLDRPGAVHAEVTGALEDIGEDAGRAQEIIANLRRLMRKSEIRRETVAVATMVTDALQIIRPDCMRQGVSVTFAAADDLPPVQGDRVQLQQVVINLVQNAATVMTSSGAVDPTVAVRAGRLEEDQVEIAVIDQGPPVTDEILSDMFEPFFTTRPQGLGMGLAICRTIVEAHGGTLNAHRNEGPGLTVACRLPLDPA